MRAINIKQADLARQSKVASSSVAAWRNGKTKHMTGETLLLAAIALKCSPKWLSTGLGPIQPDDETQANNVHVLREHDSYALSPDERSLLNNYKALEPENKKAALDYLGYLLQKQKTQNNLMKGNSVS